MSSWNASVLLSLNSDNLQRGSPQLFLLAYLCRLQIRQMPASNPASCCLSHFFNMIFFTFCHSSHFSCKIVFHSCFCFFLQISYVLVSLMVFSVGMGMLDSGFVIVRPKVTGRGFLVPNSIDLNHRTNTLMCIYHTNIYQIDGLFQLLY